MGQPVALIARLTEKSVERIERLGVVVQALEELA